MTRRLPIRQGDVLLLPVDGIPAATPAPRDNGRLILAYGEVTGHAHRIDAPEAEATILTTEDNRRFLRIVSAVALVHEEHATVTIPPGDYELPRQVEYTPAELRNVAD